jgi:hypothetical protein
MEPFSIVGMIIIAVVVMISATFLSKILKVVFYLLLFVLVLVIFFGVSYTELINWASGIVLWVF